METKDYNEPALTAQKLINKFGMTCSIVKEIGTLSDPDKPHQGGDPIYEEYETKGILLPLSHNDIKNLSSTTSVETTSKCLLSAIELEGVKPNIQDRLNFNNEIWNIIKIKPLKPTDVIIFWELILGK